MPLTEYIAVTKRICDELGENMTGNDCTEICQKSKEILQHYQKKKSHTHNITKGEREAIKTVRDDASCMVLTADKGVALVVMDKSQYVDKCMAFLVTLKSTNLVETLPKHYQKTAQRHPRNPPTAQQGIWFLQTTLVQQMPLQQIAPHR